MLLAKKARLSAIEDKRRRQQFQGGEEHPASSSVHDAVNVD
jgi:hypothetical protein